MNHQAGHERRKIKVERRGYIMEPYADVHWLLAGDIVSATAIYHDTGNGPPCTTVAIVHCEIGEELHNSDNEAMVTAAYLMRGEVVKWRQTKSQESLWVEAAIRLSLLALVEKLEAPGRLESSNAHPWIAEGKANFDAMVKKKKAKLG